MNWFVRVVIELIRNIYIAAGDFEKETRSQFSPTDFGFTYLKANARLELTPTSSLAHMNAKGSGSMAQRSSVGTNATAAEEETESTNPFTTPDIEEFPVPRNATRGYFMARKANIDQLYKKKHIPDDLEIWFEYYRRNDDEVDSELEGDVTGQFSDQVTPDSTLKREVESKGEDTSWQTTNSSSQMGRSGRAASAAVVRFFSPRVALGVVMSFLCSS